MLSLGACVVGRPEENFYVELKPISQARIAEALKVTGFSLSKLAKTGAAPKAAMASFRSWIKKTAGTNSAVFVGFNACFDWQFVNWYFTEFSEGNPFGFAGIDIKSYFMGSTGVCWAQTTSNRLPDRYKPDVPQTHNALDDAKAQASIFEKLLKERRGN